MRQQSLLALAGQCLLVRPSSLAACVEAALSLPTKLGVGDLDFFQLLGSNSCWPYDLNCRRTPCASLYRSMMSGFLLLVVSLCWSACILLICPSKPTQSNLPSSVPIRLLFSISIFLVQSQRVCLFCLAVPYCMSLFSLSLIHLKVFAMKKLSINSLCPKSSTQCIKCLTVACVTVMSSVAELESLPIFIPKF